MNVDPPSKPPQRTEPYARPPMAVRVEPDSAPARPGSPTQPGSSAQDNTWQRTLIEELARDALIERRRARRWRIFFRLGGLALAALVLLIGFGWMRGGDVTSSGRHTALIELDGIIAPDGGVQADNTIRALRTAFEDRQTAAVVLRINSPGGSPVQSGIIADEIRRLRKLHGSTPIYAVVEDVCASGGYYIASAADRIFVDKASLVGSIGVVMDGFGLAGLLDKAGIERRVLTAGDNKAFLDPFGPITPQQRAHAQGMLNEIHQQFIRSVREGRGARLKDSPEIFSGLIWTGERSLELGLADEFGSLASVARDVVKADRIVDFTHRENTLERVARRLGASIGETAVRALGGTAAGSLSGPVR